MGGRQGLVQKEHVGWRGRVGTTEVVFGKFCLSQSEGKFKTFKFRTVGQFIQIKIFLSYLIIIKFLLY